MRSTKKYQIPVLLVCVILRGSARPINILLQKGHTPCYLLEVDTSRNLKGLVANVNTSLQRETQRSIPHALARVKRGKIRTIFLHESVDFATPGSGTSQNRLDVLSLVDSISMTV